MKQNYSIFVSIALVAATMFFCGKNVDFLLYTLLGRSILVLSIIGLTLFNKYVGILATIIITILYNMNDYKEGYTGFTDENDISTGEIINPVPDSITPYGAETFSSPAEIEDEEEEEGANAEEADDNEVKANNESELATQGLTPPEHYNILV